MENKFVKDNIILFAGNLFVSISGFIYHFFSGRMLGPESYGLLGSLLSINNVIFTLAIVIQLSISKLTSETRLRHDSSRIKQIAFLFLRFLVKLGIPAAMLYFIFIGNIADFLHTDINPLLIVFLIIIFSSLLPINRGIMQGMQNFKSFSLSLVIEGLSKLIVLGIFIAVGLSVIGAMTALLLSYAVPFFISIIQLKGLYLAKATEPAGEFNFKPVLITLIALTSITLFYSADVMLVRHFLNETMSGYYAAISLIGKVVFFGSIPISFVMFPKVNELYIKGKNYYKTSYISLLGISAFGAVASTAFLLFSKFFTKLFFGSAFINIAPLIGLFSIAATLLAMINALVMFNLAIDRYKFIIILLLFNIIQIFLLWLFQSSLRQIIFMLMLLYSILLIIMLVYSYSGSPAKAPVLTA